MSSFEQSASLAIETAEGTRTYKRSIVILLGAAVQRFDHTQQQAGTISPACLSVQECVANSFVFNISSNGQGWEPTDALASGIFQTMKQLVQEKLPIVYKIVARSDLEAYFASKNAQVSLDFVKGIPDASINCYSVQLGATGGEYLQIAHAMHGKELLDNCGSINSEHFNVSVGASPQRHLRLHHAIPNLTTKKLEMVTTNEELLLDAYNKQKIWSQQLNFDSVASCNKAIMSSQSNQLIQLCEAMHEHQLVNIANRIGGTVGTIAQPGPRLVLIAGPSSSGKTTFAKRLGVTLETTGVRPIVISVDSYYKGWPDIDARGMQYVDWESLDSLNLTLLNEHLIALLVGEEVSVPEYDMKTSMPMEKEHWVKTQLPKGGLIIMEGIHCLNPNLTPRVAKCDKFQIMISPLSAVAIDNTSFISSTQVRMMRRMVRDFLFRGRSASSTLNQWPGVALGERVNIYPNQNYADIVMNSSLIYETHVLKIYAEPLLRSIRSDHGEYAEAQRLLYLLNQLVSLPGTAVPSASLLREFIGGSWYYPFAGQYKTA